MAAPVVPGSRLSDHNLLYQRYLFDRYGRANALDNEIYIGLPNSADAYQSFLVYVKNIENVLALFYYRSIFFGLYEEFLPLDIAIEEQVVQDPRFRRHLLLLGLIGIEDEDIHTRLGGLHQLCAEELELYEDEGPSHEGSDSN